MRVLFVTNFYPPHERGGQGRSCQQVVEGLQARGYETAILTSMNGTNNVPVEEDGVYRLLYLEMDFVPWLQSVTFFTKRRPREQANLQRIDHVLERFQPDVVFVWGMWNLPRSVPVQLEKRVPERILYRFADYWPTLPSQHELYWRKEGRAWYSQLPKRLMAAVALRMLEAEQREQDLQFKNSICVSAATRDVLVEAGVPVAEAGIVHTGLDLTVYDGSAPVEQHVEELNLLYAGRLHPTKGVDTAIRALAHLVHHHGVKQIRLDIAGSGNEQHVGDYEQLASELELARYVTFLGQVPYDEMPALLRKHDVLLVPSVWPEPFARTALEAMASRVVVIATTLGGTVELIEDGRNGLLFSPGDAVEMAEKVMLLVENKSLLASLAESGYRDIVEQFTVDKMLDKIESSLHTAARTDSHFVAAPAEQESPVVAQSMQEVSK